MKKMMIQAFGGLSIQYYLRQLFFGSLVALFLVYVSMRGDQPMPMNMMVFLLVSTLLYPYSRFVYESIFGFIFGQNVLFVNAILMIVVKLMTITLCWSFAIFVAPIGLLFLYFRGKPAQS